MKTITTSNDAITLNLTGFALDIGRNTRDRALKATVRTGRKLDTAREHMQQGEYALALCLAQWAQKVLEANEPADKASNAHGVWAVLCEEWYCVEMNASGRIDH